MIDLRNTREEALSIADLKSTQDHNSAVNETGNEDTEYHPKLNNRSDQDLKRKGSFTSDLKKKGSFTSEKSTDQDDDEDKETKYRLDPKYVFFIINK